MKIRSNYISNSSSSSFIIICKNQETANKVLSAYNNLYKYWITNVDIKDIENEIDENLGYKQMTAEDAVNYLSMYFYSDQEKQDVFKELDKKEQEGFKILIGCSDNEVDPEDSTIMYIFNNEIFYRIVNDDEADMIFERRGD